MQHKRGLLLPLFCGLSVCLLDTAVSRTTTAEPIKALFRMWTQVSQGNHVLGGTGTFGGAYLSMSRCGGSQCTIDVVNIICNSAARA